MNADEFANELEERLTAADARLEALALQEPIRKADRLHYIDKRDGVRLALSYLQEIRRRESAR